MHQNLPYFGNTKTHVVLLYFSFSAMLLYFPPNECPGLSKNMINFNVFHWGISSSINILFLMSDLQIMQYTCISIQYSHYNMIHISIEELQVKTRPQTSKSK